MKVDALSKRTIVYIIGKFFVQGIGLLSNVIFVRLLTTNDFGLVSVYTAWVSIITIFIGLRIDGTINNARLELENEFESYCSATVFLSLIWFLICSAITTIIILIFKSYINISIPIIIIILAFVNACGSHSVNVRTVYYASKKEPKNNLIVSVVNSLAVLLSSLILVYLFEKNKYVGRIVGLAIPSFLMALIVSIQIFKKGKVLISKRYWRYALGMSLPLIFSGLSSVILSQCDRIMIERMINASDTAIYSFAYTIAMPIYVLLNAFAESWTPDYYDYLKSGNHSDLEKHMKTYRNTFTLITVGYMMISPEVLRIVGTEDYYDSRIVVFLIIGMYYVYFLQSWSINYEFYNKKTKAVAVGFVVSAVINLVLNYFLIKLWGINGAAIATVISSLSLVLFHEIIVRIVTRGYHVKISFVLFGLLCVAAAFCFCTFFQNVLWVRWIVAIICSVIFIIRFVKNKSII